MAEAPRNIDSAPDMPAKAGLWPRARVAALSLMVSVGAGACVEEDAKPVADENEPTVSESLSLYGPFSHLRFDGRDIILSNAEPATAPREFELRFKSADGAVIAHHSYALSPGQTRLSISLPSAVEVGDFVTVVVDGREIREVPVPGTDSSAGIRPIEY